MKEKWRVLLALNISVPLIAGCGGTAYHGRDSSTPPPPPSIEAPGAVAPPKKSLNPTASQSEAAEFQEIESLYSKGSIVPGLQKIQTFKKKHPRSPLRPAVENLEGLFYLQQRQYREAIVHFNNSVSAPPKNETFNQYVFYNLASAQYGAKLYDEAIQTLNSVQAQRLDPPNRIKFDILKANLYEKQSAPHLALKQLLDAYDLTSQAELQNQKELVIKHMDQVFQPLTDLPVLQNLHQASLNTAAEEPALYYLGALESSLGRMEESHAHLNLLLTRFPSSTYALKAQEVLSHPAQVANSQQQVPVDTKSVGVLLPLKGRFERFGTMSLRGIELAFQIFGNENSEGQFNLVIQDSGEEPEQAIQGLNQLVLKHHVVGVIGPLLTKGIDQVLQRAQELNVPIVSLARRAGSFTDFVFHAGLTPQIQGFEIARYAIKDLKLTKFAVLYPNDKLGTESGFSFWDAVNSLGGKMVGFESYSVGETDFRKPIDKLAGLYYTEARKRELDFLAQERAANHITRKTRKTEQFFNLKPLVDFEAVYIPDEPKVAGQILPTFAYRDVENVKIFGPSSWNSSEFLARAQNYAEGVTVVDAFTLENQLSKTGMSHSFAEKFKATFDQDPTSIEAIAYDGALVLHHALSAGISSRPELRDSLKSINSFPGATGKLTYRDGQFYRDLQVLTVKGGQFEAAK